MAGQIGNLNPGKNQEPVVTQDPIKEFLFVLEIPADPPVARGQGPSRRSGKQQTSKRAVAGLGNNPVAQMGSHGLAVTQVVKGLQIGLPSLTLRTRRTDRYKLDWHQRIQCGLDRKLGCGLLDSPPLRRGPDQSGRKLHHTLRF